MSDIKFQSFGIIKDYFNNLNQQNGRRALIHILGDNNIAIAAADILIYLVWQTFDTDEEILNKYNGFIVRSNEQIELAVGCSAFDNSKKHMDLLIERGFVEKNNNAKDRRSCYRVNLDLVISELDRGLAEMKALQKRFTEKQSDIENKRTIRSIRRTERSIKIDLNWDTINEIVDEVFTGTSVNDERFDELLSLLGKGRERDIPMMVYVDKYWKEKFGVDYRWSEAEFNTLSYNLTNKGSKVLSAEDCQRLREAIFTLEKTERMKCKYPAKRIVRRYMELSH